MDWKSTQEMPKPKIVGRKPRILLISDVYGWAWWYKSEQLKRRLSDEFDIDIICLVGNRKSRIKFEYDLYLTYGYHYVPKILKAPKHKRITGVTAHRPRHKIEPIMRKAAVVHANSMLLYHELRQIHNIVYYLPNGVDVELFRPTKSIPRRRRNIVVGHVGKLTALKGQNEIIKPAVSKARAESVYHFNDWRNRIPLHEMVDIYNKMDVFIVASKEDGTPNPALEAAACGRPIISNRIGNMPELIKDGWNGFLVEREIDAYVEKIRLLRSNRDLLVQMGHNIRKSVESSWTWKTQAEHWRKMFWDILA